MDNCISIEKVIEIMGDSIIGVSELEATGVVSPINTSAIPAIPYSKELLMEKKRDYFLILGRSRLSNGRPMTIRNMIDIFGRDPDVAEPCFYNQDWYEKEEFIDIPMQDEWFFVRKTVFDDSRAVQPNDLMKRYTFPTAIKCTYAFFIVWLTRGIKLWYHDFVWCSDVDHNGDRVYVGKYHDIDGINKNGFSIHRHLSLRKCYGCIDC